MDEFISKFNPMHQPKFLYIRLAIFFLLSGIASDTHAQTGNKSQDTPKKMIMEVVVTDMENNPRHGEEVSFVDTASKVRYGGITDQNGEFTVGLPSGSTYLVKIKEIGEEQKYQVFSIPELQADQEYRKSRYLIKYDPPRVFTLDNVYFDVNKANLREASYAELNELADYMKRRKGIRVEIAGHTDNVGTRENNQMLSRRRADRVKQYLVSEGIASGRIEAKGYGEDRPVAGNNTEEGRQKNRRTEVHIINDPSSN